eukprot:Platyproteum_vivax@DN15838_c0_g1_i1.p1
MVSIVALLRGGRGNTPDVCTLAGLKDLWGSSNFQTFMFVAYSLVQILFLVLLVHVLYSAWQGAVVNNHAIQSPIYPATPYMYMQNIKHEPPMQSVVDRKREQCWADAKNYHISLRSNLSVKRRKFWRMVVPFAFAFIAGGMLNEKNLQNFLIL